MTEGGKHQGMARQQHTIDELELKVKNISKHIEDADNAKKMALKSELKLKDDVLRLEAQLEALKETYEGELGTLKPMVHEQVRCFTSDISVGSLYLPFSPFLSFRYLIQVII
jgi:seryl-tRNA synthetase